MGKKAEQFLQEVKVKGIKQKKGATQLNKHKKRLFSHLLGYLIIITGVLYTVYKFQSNKIELSTTITFIFLSLFFGGIFILFGKHYGE
tara:strand:- start:434 stop:697 length:264 start_codon:yes stop_codon:yes gene_type:complete